MGSKWEAVLDSRPVPLSEHLLVECSKLFARDLIAWPPPVTEPDASVSALLMAHPTAPRPVLIEEAFRLTRWDLQHDLDAYDDYMRNRHWISAGLSLSDKPLLLFLSRFMLEQLSGLSEATEGRVNRQALLRVLDLTERAVLKRADA